MTKPSKEQYESCPHVVWTSDVVWESSTLDNEIDPEDLQLMELTLTDVSTDVINQEEAADVLTSITERTSENKKEVNRKELDWRSLLKKCFACVPTEVLQQTFTVAKQFMRKVRRIPFRSQCRSRFWTLNVSQKNEPLTKNNTSWSNTPAVANSGAGMA